MFTSVRVTVQLYTQFSPSIKHLPHKGQDRGPARQLHGLGLGGGGGDDDDEGEDNVKTIQI